MKFEAVVRETEKAWLIRMDGLDRWIPKAACHIKDSEIQIEEWFARNMDDAGALFSDDRKHRYVLWRKWNKRGKMALCCGLNPSTANQDQNDPTITRLMQTLSAHGYGGFYMVNLFTVISSSPDILLDPKVKEDEEMDIGIIFAYSINVDDVIFCWGTFEEAKARAQRLIDFYQNALCFGKNKDGSPWHPMALMYAGLKPKDARLHGFRHHQYQDNVYNRRITAKEKQRELNAKQFNLIP